MKKINKYTIEISLACLIFVIATVSAYAEGLLKTENHSIPVSDKCPIVEPFLKGKPKVIYFDDVGVQNADPNGLQELPIIMGLHREKINLLAIATHLPDPASGNLFTSIVSASKHNDVDIIATSEIAQRIVDEAKCVPAGQYLYVALGGEWFELENALRLDNSNSDKIFAVGWQIANGETGLKKASYNRVRDSLPGRAIAIDTLTNLGIPVLDENGYPKTQYFSKPHQSLRTFHLFRQTSSYSHSDFSDFYDANLRPILDDFADNHGRNITDESRWYITEAIALNRRTELEGPGTGTKTKLRIADFLTIAYVLDRSTMFDTQAMFNLVEDAINNF